MPTTRADFENLIELRLQEAKLLLDNQQWDGAYYLAGYAVEYALKVKIIALLMGSNAFPERRDAESFYRHSLKDLRQLAKLQEEMDADTAVNDHWTFVKDWSEQSRYQVGRTEKDARTLFDAITTRVLPWIKARW